MSLSSQEQRTLHSIGAQLARSDPELAVLLSTFARLAAGEKMPAREVLRPCILPSARHLRRGSTPAGAARRNERRPMRPRPGRLAANRLVIVTWVLITAALIAVAVIIGQSSDHDGCAQSRPAGCAGSSPAPAGQAP